MSARETSLGPTFEGVCKNNKEAKTALVGNARPSWDFAVCKLV